MKIICSWCKSSIGEKCSQCGREVIALSGDEIGIHLQLTGKVFYVCWSCSRGWTEGLEGETHGVCEKCKENIGRSMEVNHA